MKRVIIILCLVGAFAFSQSITLVPPMTGGGGGAVSKEYDSASELTVVAADQSHVIVNMTEDITVMPLDVTGVSDGDTIRWRFVADEEDRTVYWPTNTGVFRIPSSSAMATNSVVAAGTISVFGTEYVESRGQWLIQAYIWGY